MAKDPTCEDQVDAEQYGNEQNFRLIFAHEAPDAVADPGFAISYIDHAIDVLGYEADEDETALIDVFRKAVAAKGPEWVQVEVPADNATYADMPIADAVSEQLKLISGQTTSRRYDIQNEQVFGVDTVVTVTMKIELSGGGPADYVTAVLDPQSREISNIRYHYTEWGDHASRPVEPESALGQLAAYYSETVTIDPIPTDEDR